jgi:uncharacterized phage protein (TIGR01671 family)
MREILFKAKEKDDGKWIEGFPVRIYDYGGLVWDIHPFNTNLEITHSVDPKTICQFTGKVDKNGNKIFEGDIFQLEDDIVAVVVFSDGCFRLEEYGLCGTWTESGYDECGGGYGILNCDPIDWYSLFDMEIIGNIHDNPELIPC